MKKNTEDLKDVKKDDEKQSQRFVETAERLESDKSGDSFSRFFQKSSLVSEGVSRPRPSVKRPSS